MSEVKKFAPDVTKFSGYVAVDGTHHKTSKLAIDHSRDVKVKAALEAFASSAELPFCEDANCCVLTQDDLAAFLLKNKDAIQAAFGQDVVMRKPRSPSTTPRKARADKGTKRPAAELQANIDAVAQASTSALNDATAALAA